MTEAVQTRPRRFQFSLRGMLGLVALGAVAYQPTPYDE
jgi:hypothetical protein